MNSSKSVSYSLNWPTFWQSSLYPRNYYSMGHPSLQVLAAEFLYKLNLMNCFNSIRETLVPRLISSVGQQRKLELVYRISLFFAFDEEESGACAFEISETSRERRKLNKVDVEGRD